MASGSPELSAADRLRIAGELLELGAWLVSQRTDPTALGCAITNGYYAALHAVSAYFLAHHHESVTSHVERERLLRNPRYPEFGRQDQLDYFGLKDASEDARYRGQAFAFLDHAKQRARAERLVAKWGDRARKAIAR